MNQTRHDQEVGESEDMRLRQTGTPTKVKPDDGCMGEMTNQDSHVERFPSLKILVF